MTGEVIVRAYGGRPAHLVAIERKGVLVYVANPSSMERLEEGLTEPVGVPLEDVFEFEEAAFAKLSDHWTRGAEGFWSKLDLTRFGESPA